MFSYFRKKQGDYQHSGNQEHHNSNDDSKVLKLPSHFFEELMGQATNKIQNTEITNNELIGQKQVQYQIKDDNQLNDELKQPQETEYKAFKKENNGQGQQEEKIGQVQRPRSENIITVSNDGMDEKKYRNNRSEQCVRIGHIQESSVQSNLSEQINNRKFSHNQEINAQLPGQRKHSYDTVNKNQKEHQKNVQKQQFQKNGNKPHPSSSSQTYNIPQSQIQSNPTTKTSSIGQILESTLLQTKQKYNQLVDQSTNLFLKSKQIANLVNEFVMSINLFFQSEELLIPAKEIEKGISELNAQRTEKYINYLIRIFQANFQEVIEKRVKKVKQTLEQELRKSQKRSKELEAQIRIIKQSFNKKQQTFTQTAIKQSEHESLISKLNTQIQELSAKLSLKQKNEQSLKQDCNSELLLVKRQLQRSRKQLEQSVNSNRKLQKQLQKALSVIREKQEQIEKLSQVIKKVKQLQYEGMENMVQEMEVKEKVFRDKMERFTQDKIYLQGKIKTVTRQKQQEVQKRLSVQKQCMKLKQEIGKLTTQLNQLKNKERKQLIEQEEEGEHTSQNNSHQTVNQNKEPCQVAPRKQSTISSIGQSQPIDLSKLINKQILGHLFLSYIDESKQWSVRNNIKNQIYILLDLNKSPQTKPNNLVVVSGTQNKQNHLQGAQLKSNQHGSLGKQSSSAKKSTQGSLIGKWLGW